MLKAIRTWVTNKLMRHICNALVFDELMEVSYRKDPKGNKTVVIFVGDQMLNENEVKEFIAEARTIRKLNIWRKLLADMKSKATNDLVNRSKIVDDMVFAKAMLYTIDVLAKKVEQIADL